MVKWTSNSRAVLTAIPENERADGVKNLDLDQETLPIERALGIHWNVESDTFQFKIVIKDRPLTRRGLLSIVSSIYDPLGFLAPVVLPAKMILHDLSRLKIGWDDDLPEQVKQSWTDWLTLNSTST